MLKTYFLVKFLKGVQELRKLHFLDICLNRKFLRLFSIADKLVNQLNESVVSNIYQCCTIITI